MMWAARTDVRNAARHTLLLLLVGGAALLAGCERPPVQSQQGGYRGTGMQQVTNPRLLEQTASLHVAPKADPAASKDGPRAGQIYQNVKVLGDLSVGEFSRTMSAITAWVAPKEGCAYCHNLQNLADDSKYTKVVARRMVQMTQHINVDWKNHVAGTGVTCYTCHRGNPVPANVWFTSPTLKQAKSLLGDDSGQNKASKSVVLASLPYDPFTPYLLSKDASDIRVNGNTALPTGNRHSIKQAEHTYGLMMHMSQSLGVNCTFCHNTRSFASWEGPPQRVTAYYGIRMVRDVNSEYVVPLTDAFPPNRHGELGDVAKVNCATCHQGVNKPLNGASMIADYPELARVAASGPVLPPTVSSAQGATLFFGVGSSTVAGDAVAGLQALIASLKANAGAKVAISGYHSAAGDLASNQELAKQRAMSVRDLLKAGGVEEGRVALQKPVSAEANLTGEDPKARRVEVLVK